MVRLDRLDPAEELAQIGAAMGRTLGKPKVELASALERFMQAHVGYGDAQSRALATQHSLVALPFLILSTKSLNVRFAVRVEELLAALLPRRFEFGRCDVPVRSAFLGNGT